MSIYLYTMRAKTANVIINNRIQTVNLLAFSAIRNSAWASNVRAERSAITRADNFWAGKETPTLYAIGDKFEDGIGIWQGWPAGMAYCDDTEFPGVGLGFMKKVKRSWILSDTP